MAEISIVVNTGRAAAHIANPREGPEPFFLDGDIRNSGADAGRWGWERLQVAQAAAWTSESIPDAEAAARGGVLGAYAKMPVMRFEVQELCAVQKIAHDPEPKVDQKPS